VSKVGTDNPILFVQANGWGPGGDWGASSASIETQMDAVWTRRVPRGEQAIQPSDYDWTTLYGMLYTNSATYAEVYDPSFGMASKATLASEIGKFADACAKKVPLP
jgi:hypothetical protein